MFQFNELLTLALGLVLATYLVANWRRVRAVPLLRPLLVPMLLFFVSWVCTVAEGAALDKMPEEGLIVFHQPSIGLASEGGVAVQALNVAEHVAAAVAGIWLLVALVHLFRSERE